MYIHVCVSLYMYVHFKVWPSVDFGYVLWCGLLLSLNHTYNREADLKDSQSQTEGLLQCRTQ